MNKPYRGCPVCRNGLPEPKQIVELGEKWEVFECDNCGSEVWVMPFKRIAKHK